MRLTAELPAAYGPNPLPGFYRKCYAIASRAHRGQRYGTHLAYFKAHVLPLAEFFKKRGMWKEACLALLHDVIEDHPDKVTYTKLRGEGLPEWLLDALRCITREYGEDYDAYLARVRTDDLAWRVKLRDVLSNISAPRTNKRLLRKYASALLVLGQDAPDHVFT